LIFGKWNEMRCGHPQFGDGGAIEDNLPPLWGLILSGLETQRSRAGLTVAPLALFNRCTGMIAAERV
jgi:hypothetical protein